MLKAATYILLISSLTSCVKQEEDKWQQLARQREENKVRVDKENDASIMKLLRKNEAWAGWDTSNLYTWALQEAIIDSSLMIAFPGTVNDIFKKDSSYYLLISHSHLNSHYTGSERKDYRALVRMNREQLILLSETLQKPGNSHNGMFVLKAESIIPHAPQLKHELDEDWFEPDATPEIEFSLDYGYIYLTFHGALIDFCLMKAYDDQ
jgi:hypothetical protein